MGRAKLSSGKTRPYRRQRQNTRAGGARFYRNDGCQVATQVDQVQMNQTRTRSATTQASCRAAWSSADLEVLAQAMDELQYPCSFWSHDVRAKALHSKFRALGGSRKCTPNAVEVTIRTMLRAQHYVADTRKISWGEWFELTEDRRFELLQGCPTNERCILSHMNQVVAQVVKQAADRISGSCAQHPDAAHARTRDRSNRSRGMSANAEHSSSEEAGCSAGEAPLLMQTIKTWHAQITDLNVQMVQAQHKGWEHLVDVLLQGEQGTTTPHDPRVMQLLSQRGVDVQESMELLAKQREAIGQTFASCIAEKMRSS